MDKAMSNGSSKPLPAGVSIRNGPVVDDEMDIDSTPATNGNAKRKARNSTSKPVTYKDDSDDSDAVPLVGLYFARHHIRISTDSVSGKTSKNEESCRFG